MTWYTAGTITVTNGSPVVTGAGTDFVANVQPRDALIVGAGSPLEIASVQSATQLTLAGPWLGATSGGQTYKVQPTVGVYVDLALRALGMLTPFQAVIDGIGQGLVPAGTVVAPGLRFTVDQDTGVRSVGENALALVCGGVDRLVVDPTGVRIGGPGSLSLLDGSGRGVTVSGGNVLVGAGTNVGFGAAHRISKTTGEGSMVVAIDNGVEYVVAFRAAVGGGFSLAEAALWIGKHSVSGRSINAGGTINASGADYAEYVTKAAGCGDIAKGDVCGVDRNGRLTRRWADAVRYVVKSTDPNLVGGDTWAAHLPPRPDAPSDAPVEAALAEWERALEESRQTVDRIAFCGQVPVNVDEDTLAASAAALEDGEAVYLVALARGGGIGAQAVRESDMTLPLYMHRLGAVWAIRDGRPIIDVQHG